MLKPEDRNTEPFAGVWKSIRKRICDTVSARATANLDATRPRHAFKHIQAAQGLPHVGSEMLVPTPRILLRSKLRLHAQRQGANDIAAGQFLSTCLLRSISIHRLHGYHVALGQGCNRFACELPCQASLLHLFIWPSRNTMRTNAAPSVTPAVFGKGNESSDAGTLCDATLMLNAARDGLVGCEEAMTMMHSGAQFKRQVRSPNFCEGRCDPSSSTLLSRIHYFPALCLATHTSAGHVLPHHHRYFGSFDIGLYLCNAHEIPSPTASSRRARQCQNHHLAWWRDHPVQAARSRGHL